MKKMKKWTVYDNKNNKKEINILDVIGIGVLRYVHHDPEQSDAGPFDYALQIKTMYAEYWMNSYTYLYDATVDVKFYLMEWAETIKEYGREKWQSEHLEQENDFLHDGSEIEEPSEERSL